MIKIGRSSLGVIIPADFIHSIGVKSGDMVKVHTNPTHGKLKLLGKHGAPPSGMGERASASKREKFMFSISIMKINK